MHGWISPWKKTNMPGNPPNSMSMWMKQTSNKVCWGFQQAMCHDSHTQLLQGPLTRSQCKVHDLVQLASLETWWSGQLGMWASKNHGNFWRFATVGWISSKPCFIAKWKTTSTLMTWNVWSLLHLQTLGRALLFDDVWRHFFNFQYCNSMKESIYIMDLLEHPQ